MLVSMEKPLASPWADLSPPLLELILERLPFVDYLRLPAVCVSFRDVQHEHRLRHAASPRYQRQMPWLLLSDHQSLLNPSEDRYYPLPLPENYNYERVSRYGWILLSTENSYVLVNAFTGSQIPIPFPQVNHHRYAYSSRLGDLSSVPTDPDCVLLLDCKLTRGDDDGDGSFYVFYRFRDRIWTNMILNRSSGRQFAFCGGIFYEFSSDYIGEGLYETEPLLSPLERYHAMDNTALKVVGKRRNRYERYRSVEWDEYYLVECEGQLLLARSIWKKSICTFVVFKADLDDDVWVKIDSFGDYVLFLSDSDSSFSLSAAETQGPGNHIFLSYNSSVKNRRMLAEYNYGSHQVVNSGLANLAEQHGEDGWRSYEWIVPSMC